jgi:hypothetical protein
MIPDDSLIAGGWMVAIGVRIRKFADGRMTERAGMNTAGLSIAIQSAWAAHG